MLDCDDDAIDQVKTDKEQTPWHWLRCRSCSRYDSLQLLRWCADMTGCGGNKELVQITPPRRARVQIIEAPPAEPDKPAPTIGDFYCPTCKELEFDLNLPHRHVCQPGLRKRLNAIDKRLINCNVCTANDDGNCVELPDGENDIAEGVTVFSHKCPRWHWLALRINCPKCNARLCSHDGVDSCWRCDWQGHKVVEMPAFLPKEVECIEAEGPIDVVWVYHMRGQQKNEIIQSIKSVKKNLKDWHRLFVCGDKPRWRDEGSLATHIESTKRASGDLAKWFDSIHKLQRIIDDNRVSDNFLWIYDDTFVMQSLSVVAIGRGRYNGKLRSTPRRRRDLAPREA